MLTIKEALADIMQTHIGKNDLDMDMGYGDVFMSMRTCFL